MSALQATCPHCKNTVNVSDYEFKVWMCSCGESILRDQFLYADGKSPAELLGWSEAQIRDANARSLRSIAVSLQVLASCASHETSADRDDARFDMRRVYVNAFEESE